MSSIGRNDPCPCGSGKKYKKCCLPVPADIPSSQYQALSDVMQEALPNAILNFLTLELLGPRDNTPEQDANALRIREVWNKYDLDADTLKVCQGIGDIIADKCGRPPYTVREVVHIGCRLYDEDDNNYKSLMDDVVSRIKTPIKLLFLDKWAQDDPEGFPIVKLDPKTLQPIEG